MSQRLVQCAPKPDIKEAMSSKAVVLRRVSAPSGISACFMSVNNMLPNAAQAFHIFLPRMQFSCCFLPPSLNLNVLSCGSKLTLFQESAPRVSNKTVVQWGPGDIAQGFARFCLKPVHRLHFGAHMVPGGAC